MAQKLLSLYSSLNKLATNLISKQTVLHLAPFKLQTKLLKTAIHMKKIFFKQSNSVHKLWGQN